MKCVNIFVAMAGVWMGGCVTESDGPEWSLSVGDRVPEFVVEMADGEVVDSRELAGEPGMLVLFNTGCDDCREELPRVQVAYEMVEDEGIEARFLCIAREEEASSIEAFWHAKGLTLPYAPQKGREVFNLFALSGIPRIYVYDSELCVTATFSDVLLPTAQDIVAEVRKAAARQP